MYTYNNPTITLLITANLFTDTIEQIKKKSELKPRGIDIDGEKIADLRFADDVALTTNSVKDGNPT